MPKRDSYREDWEAVDGRLDRGLRLRWADSPAWKWLGTRAEELLALGLILCPVCEDERGPGEICLYCLREGNEVLPSPKPRFEPTNKPAKFQPRRPKKIGGLP